MPKSTIVTIRDDATRHLAGAPEVVAGLVLIFGVADLLATGLADEVAVGLGDKLGLGSVLTSGVGLGLLAVYLPLSQTK